MLEPLEEGAAPRGDRADGGLRAAGDQRQRHRAQLPRDHEAAGTRDRRRALLRRRSTPFPGQSIGLRRAAAETRSTGAAGKTVTFEFTPPGAKTRPISPSLVRCGSRGRARRSATWSSRSRRRELNQQLLPLLERLALAFARRHPRRRAARPGTCRAGSRGPCWRCRRRPTRSRAAATTSTCPRCAAAARSAISPTGSARWRQRLSEAEQLERNFLMSVSHELRTPLTAIRGHVEALREGVAEDPEARAASLDVIAHESGRLERLVGDVLDLAKLDAHRFTVLHEEVDMGRLCDQAYAAFGEEARRRGIDYDKQFEAQPDDRHRRRPRAADHLQPALERLPLDAGRRARRARARRVERARRGRGRRQRPRHRAARSRSGSSGRSGRATTPAPASGSRSRTSSRSRSAGGSSSSPSPARAAASSSCCPSGTI